MRHTQADLFKLLKTMDRLLGVHTRLGVFECPDLCLVSYPGSGLEPGSEGLEEKIKNTYRAASTKCNILIPYLPLHLQDFPSLFETRMTVLEIPDTQFITLSQIDRHDATISHLLRGNKKDLDAIKKLSRNSGLSYDGLMDSFCAIDSEGRDTRRLKQDFLNLLEYLFGAAAVSHAEAVISERASF